MYKSVEIQHFFYYTRRSEYNGEGDIMSTFIQKYIGPKAFYKRVGKIAVPLALQMILNQAAGFVDTIMVSRIGGVGAVSIATQLDIIMMNVGFGINSGGGMYGAQFYGAKDYKSLKKIFCEEF